MESGQLQVDEPAALTAYDGLVHTMTGRGWHMLPLDPWLIYRADDNGTMESLWLFDGFDAKTVRYRSPLRPGVTLVASDLRRSLDMLLGG